MKENIKNWEELWDDLVFLNRLSKLCYVDFGAKSFPEKQDFIKTVSNPGAIDIYKDKFLWIGHTDEDNEDTESTWYSHFTEHMGLGSARVLQAKWIVENVDDEFVRNLKQKANWNRLFPISKKLKNKIRDNMASLRTKNVTHIYKYTCPTTYQMKFCNAVPVRNRTTDSTKDFEAIRSDEITKEWLYITAVKLNDSKTWFDQVMNPGISDQFFELPTAAVAKNATIIPEKVKDAPMLRYPQHSEGVCGISAFSSAFFYRFDQNLAFIIYQKKKEYREVLATKLYNKKSPAMKYLNSIIQENQKIFKDFTVQRVKQMISWKQLFIPQYYNNILLCIPKSSSFSKDHIIGITKGWIFDGNLEYAMPLTEENITWSASHGKEGLVFSGFWEQVIVKKKDKKPNEKQK